MARRRIRTLSVLCVALAAGCAGTTCDAPEPDELGDRLRVRVAGRGEEPTITSADYFIYLVMVGPGGERAPVRVYAPESIGCEGLALITATAAFPSRLDPAFEDSRHGDADHCEDIVVPDGYRFAFEPGAFYAYRVVGGTRRMVADLEPELHFGQVRADGGGYLELTPAAAPDLERADDPPGWPPRGR